MKALVQVAEEVGADFSDQDTMPVLWIQLRATFAR